MQYPMRGERVVVVRQSGLELTARRDYMLDSFFRERDKLHWLDDDNKFADVRFDPVVSWRPL